MRSIEETTKFFESEAKKLESAINAALAKSELSIPEIVETYYQTMNVTSLAIILKQQLGGSDENNSLIRTIEETQKLILEKFDSNLHPLIMTQLANSLIDTTKSLQFGNTLEKSKTEIEADAKLYEKLRQTMSTKEFVEQYDKGLSHD